MSNNSGWNCVGQPKKGKVKKDISRVEILNQI